MLDQLGGQGRVALGAILGGAVAALCCIGLYTAKDNGPAPAENLLPVALSRGPVVVTGELTTGVAPTMIAMTTSALTKTTTSTRSSTTTTKPSTATRLTTTTAVTTTTFTTTQPPTTTVPPTTTTTHRCGWLFC